MVKTKTTVDEAVDLSATDTTTATGEEQATYTAVVTDSEPVIQKVVKSPEGVIVEAELIAVSVRGHGVGVSEN